ncbi:unnamed protein product, partial [Mesorhabditis spiculigera]
MHTKLLSSLDQAELVLAFLDPQNCVGYDPAVNCSSRDNEAPSLDASCPALPNATWSFNETDYFWQQNLGCANGNACIQRCAGLCLDLPTIHSDRENNRTLIETLHRMNVCDVNQIAHIGMTHRMAPQSIIRAGQKNSPRISTLTQMKKPALRMQKIQFLLSILVTSASVTGDKSWRQKNLATLKVSAAASATGAGFFQKLTAVALKTCLSDCISQPNCTSIIWCLPDWSCLRSGFLLTGNTAFPSSLLYPNLTMCMGFQAEETPSINTSTTSTTKSTAKTPKTTTKKTTTKRKAATTKGPCDLIPQEATWTYNNTNYYLLQPNCVLGNRCQDICSTNKLQVATVHSQKEQDQLKLKMSQLGKCAVRLVHLGLGYVKTAHNYRNIWRDRSPVDYVNWDVGSPSRTTNYQNTIVPENCTLMNNNGKWNDVGCSFFCYADAACLCMKRC